MPWITNTVIQARIAAAFNTRGPMGGKVTYLFRAWQWGRVSPGKCVSHLLAALPPIQRGTRRIARIAGATIDGHARPRAAPPAVASSSVPTSIGCCGPAAIRSIPSSCRDHPSFPIRPTSSPGLPCKNPSFRHRRMSIRCMASSILCSIDRLIRPTVGLSPNGPGRGALSPGDPPRSLARIRDAERSMALRASTQACRA